MNDRCLDCGGLIPIPKNIEENEIVSCPSCGCEYYISKEGKLCYVELLGDDSWGE